MRNTFAIAILILTAAACGKSAEQKAAEQAAQQAAQASQQAAQATQQAAQQIAQGAQQMAQGPQQAAQGGAQSIAAGLQAMAQGLQQTGADGKPVPPVDFEKLIALLPDASGWTKSKPTGGTRSMGFSVSNAEANYQKGDQRIQLEITDAAFNSLVMAPFRFMMAAGYNERTTEGFKRAMTLNGAPGYEEWTNDSKRGEVTVVVGNRFVVSGKGNGVDNIDAVRNFVSQVDLAKLAATK